MFRGTPGTVHAGVFTDAAVIPLCEAEKRPSEGIELSLTAGSAPQRLRVLTPASDESDITQWAGGKGRNLYTLTASGFQVPRWSVLGLDVFAEFARGSGLDAYLESLPADGRGGRGGWDGPDGRVREVAGEVAGEIAALIEKAPLDEPVAAAIAIAYQEVGGGAVAVRSSGAQEDGTRHSFAGQFDTFLDIRGPDQVAAHVRRCWASGFSERSLRYRARCGLPLNAGGVAVVVQRMVPAERSGVLFTADPATGRTDRHVVGAVHGLGEGLVSGSVDADTVVMDATTGEPLKVEPASGERADGESASGQQIGEEPVLSAGDLALLHRTGVRIAELQGAPQDIEWAIADGTLWILQTRPLTALGRAAADTRPPPPGEARLWDNSNIIESFGGVVSPLTYSFAADTYAKVYESYARALGVRGERLREVREWTPHLLGYFHGRVYYNLYHWYRMVRLAPLYPLGRRVLEKSLGVAESISDECADALHPFTHRTGPRARFSQLIRTAVFIRRFLAIGKSVDAFHRDFYRVYEEFNDIDYDALPGDETYRRFRRLQRELIEKWGPMQVLDATILLSVGVLALLTRRWLPDAPDWFTWAAAAPAGPVESAEPARALAELAELVRTDDGARRLLERTADADARDALREGGHTRLLTAVDAYVAAYGYRSPDELKLEVPDLRENPAGLFALLREALGEDSPGGARGRGGTGGRHGEADAYLDAHLRGPRRWVYERVRRKARAALTDRERLRFCRTRAFGAAKRMLRAMGRDLARAGAIESWIDVFMLKLAEVGGAYEGSLAHGELKELAALRRRRLAADAALHAPARFTTHGAPYWSGNLERAGWTEGPAARSGIRELRGTPCCPGVAEGPAMVTDSPRETRGAILVAYRTDPGWVPALASAAAVVVERGSPLTHVAVVARELGVPTVVQVRGATTEIRTGTRLRVDGAAGTVTVLDAPAAHEDAPAADDPAAHEDAPTAAADVGPAQPPPAQDSRRTENLP
ncbi:phosphoenolpyruvate synthase [Streptomyces anandii]|uniref:phosphoenolpyruvate synthase n=1 Tax=Streptomyces anandii TaxID=285454 RepID=UPI00167980D2|nr:phosphoenolpyruvate synthase [Streptomyces anandii]